MKLFYDHLFESKIHLNKCKKCEKDFEIGIKDFCSKKCVQIYFDGKIADAVATDELHIKRLTT